MSGEKKSFSVRLENLHESAQKAMEETPDIVTFRIIQGKCASFLKDTSRIHRVSLKDFAELVERYKGDSYISNVLEGVAAKHLGNALHEVRQAFLEVIQEQIIPVVEHKPSSAVSEDDDDLFLGDK